MSKKFKTIEEFVEVISRSYKSDYKRWLNDNEPVVWRG